jgi:DNA-binding response OmpR family regulator
MAHEKILVIDDDAGVVSVLHSILTDEGFDVVTADSGIRGLEILQEYTPHLILLDLKMPGMSGVGFLNEISGEDGKPKYPVLVLTAHGNMSGFFKNIDIDGFMLKPVRGTELIAEVNRILCARNIRKTSTPEAVMSKRKKVLIAEDDDEVSNILALAFLRAGYTTEQTNNGSDAIGKTILSRPDVLVIKMLLSSMNGNKVAAILRTIPKTNPIPIVLYDQDGLTNPLRDSLLKNGDINAFVPGNGSREILDAVDRVTEGR